MGADAHTSWPSSIYALVIDKMEPATPDLTGLAADLVRSQVRSVATRQPELG